MYDPESVEETPQQKAADYAARGYPEEAAETIADAFSEFMTISTARMKPPQIAALIDALAKRGFASETYRYSLDLFLAVQP